MGAIVRIKLWPPHGAETACHVCGCECANLFGLPVGVDAEVKPNDFEGEWAGVPACARCYRAHEKWDGSGVFDRATVGKAFMIDLKPNTYVLIRVDGSETTIAAPPNVRRISRDIGANCLDTVILTKRHGRAELVMLVDDTGMVDGRPVNRRASELVRESLPGYPCDIHGDVAVVDDRSFAP